MLSFLMGVTYFKMGVEKHQNPRDKITENNSARPKSGFQMHNTDQNLYIKSTPNQTVKHELLAIYQLGPIISRKTRHKNLTIYELHTHSEIKHPDWKIEKTKRTTYHRNPRPKLRRNCKPNRLRLRSLTQRPPTKYHEIEIWNLRTKRGCLERERERLV